MDVATKIRSKRGAAAMARQLAVAFSTEDDRSRILFFADELDAQADALEQHLTSATPPSQATKQTQVQIQQQAATRPDKKK